MEVCAPLCEARASHDQHCNLALPCLQCFIRRLSLVLEQSVFSSLPPSQPPSFHLLILLFFFFLTFFFSDTSVLRAIPLQLLGHFLSENKKRSLKHCKVLVKFLYQVHQPSSRLTYSFIFNWVHSYTFFLKQLY